ncbi:FAD/FMN-containing isoamyl alcohol oxidase MreA [Xylariales sp. PMI_506]|nr:FAD/FMN-containing isoamyl alcohol oxidase MreA [Xylariales sp. PMI_506]
MLNTFLLCVTLGKSCIGALTSNCRYLPGDSGWPNAEEWATFNASVSGNLIRTVPIASVCHGLQYNEAACTALQQVWQNDKTHYTTSSSIAAALYANQSCDPFTPRDAQCVIGTYVQYAVNVSNPDHISKTLKFAHEKNIRLVVRNTGHDYLGKSTGAGGLAIWTHNMKAIEKLDWNSYLYSGPAIKMGAGIQGFEALAFADAYGLAVITGYCPTVGIAGGYVQGAGHGGLVSKYGLATDNALEFEVVDALGNLLIANTQTNSDLFWALRGGGGSTYGVIISVTVKAFPTESVISQAISLSRDNLTSDVFRAAIATFLEVVPDLVDANCYVLAVLSSESFVLRDLMAPGLSEEQVDTLLEPWISFMESHNISYQRSLTLFQTIDQYFAEGGPQSMFNGSANSNQLGNWLVPRSTVTYKDRLFQYVDTVLNFSSMGATTGIVGFNVSGRVDNAVLPAWRDALFYTNVLLTEPVNETLEEANERLLKLDRNFISQLRALAPTSGVYLNEADPQDLNWKQDFYGPNYERLLSIKNKYDPHHLFYALTAVGSDYWVEQPDKGLCRAVGY